MNPFKFFLFVGLLLLSSFSLAASFDCGKASTPIEKAICEHPPLDEIDSHLGQLYQELRQSSSKEHATRLQAEQQAWLKERSTACSLEDTDCLVELYQKRIDQLSLPTVKKLQGRWQSTEDKKSVIEIKGNDYIDYYDGKSVSSVTFEVLKACKSENGEVGKHGEYLETSEEMCYHIDSVNSQELVLTYLPRGNLLTYKKLKD